MKGTRKQCRKNGRFVGCKKKRTAGKKRGNAGKKRSKTVSKRRCRSKGRFVNCKQNKTRKSRLCRKKGRFVKCSDVGTDGGGFKEIASALLGINRSKQVPFVATKKEHDEAVADEEKQKMEMARLSNRSVEFQNENAEENFTMETAINVQGREQIAAAEGTPAEGTPAERVNSYEDMEPNELTSLIQKVTPP